jgi:ubiquinone/menaquinone biosynthesis C-methylase UbiE
MKRRDWTTYWSTRTNGGHRHSEEEWLRRYAEEILLLVPGGGVLVDVGCGAGEITTYLAPHFDRVWAFDFSESMLEAARQRIRSRALSNIELRLGCAEKFPAEITEADVVLSVGVVQYLRKQEILQHLRECHRVLSPGGTAGVFWIPEKNVKWLSRLGGLQGDGIGFWAFLVRWLRYNARALRSNGPCPDGIGSWYSKQEIETIARQARFRSTFVNCWHYEYRFNAILKKMDKPRSDRGKLSANQSACERQYRG